MKSLVDILRRATRWYGFARGPDGEYVVLVNTFLGPDGEPGYYHVYSQPLRWVWRDDATEDEQWLIRSFWHGMYSEEAAGDGDA